MRFLYETFVNLGFKTHLGLAFFVRICLILYGVYHDQISSVSYTDVDYKVFTDASRHILHNGSPYDRHTYRYSPLIALFLIPNLLLHHTFGKFLFCTIDILVALLIRIIVKHSLQEYESYKEKSEDKPKQIKKRKNKNKNRTSTKKSSFDRIADISMLTWLYNPLTIAIGTRGNCDSLSSFLVLLTLFFLQCKKQYFIAGLIHGVSIHFRLYPLIYSLTYFMFLSKFSVYTTEDRRKKKQFFENGPLPKQIKASENRTELVRSYGKPEKKTIFKIEYLMYLIPNAQQIKLVSGCLLALSFLTALFYQLYGYKFLFETYIFHLIRKDTRHNFSLYFYLQYLTAWVKNIGVWQKVLTVLPQLVLLVVFSCRYGLNKFSLNFSILTQTIVLVIYNTVLTSQYFVWIMAVLPLCLWQIHMPTKTVIFLITIWFAGQAAWLLPAYLLEFQGQNTFFFIWIQGVSFFCANIAILGRLIIYFMPLKSKSA